LAVFGWTEEVAVSCLSRKTNRVWAGAKRSKLNNFYAYRKRVAQHRR